MEYKDYSIQIVAKQDNLAVPKNVNFPKRKDKSLDLSFLEAPPGIEPGNKGFADLCLTAWLWCLINIGRFKVNL